MTPEKLFHELLGLGLNWEVVASRFERDSGTVFLELRETPKLWESVRRPQDTGLVYCYDHTEVLTWRHLNIFQHRCAITCRLRRAEVRLGGAGVWDALKQSQWLRRKNPEHLTEKEQTRLAQIGQKSLRTAKAYQMRLVLQDIYRSPTAGAARRRFRVWCRWVRWVARQAPKNLLRAMVKVADLVENHLAGIVAHWKWGVTNAFREGLNSVFSATKRKARGYRSTTHLIAMLYFVAGKLRLPQLGFHREQRRTKI